MSIRLELVPDTSFESRYTLNYEPRDVLTFELVPGATLTLRAFPRWPVSVDAPLLLRITAELQHEDPPRRRKRGARVDLRPVPIPPVY